MQEKLNRPKRFGEMLDTIFSLSRQRFIEFFKIYLFIIGPIILIEMAVEIWMGKSLFRDVGPGMSFVDKMLNTFAFEEEVVEGSTEDLLYNAIFTASNFLMVFAMVGVVLAVNQIRKGEAFQAGSSLRQAFKRAPAIFGSVFLFFVMFIGVIFAVFIGVLFIALIVEALPTLIATIVIVLAAIGIFIVVLYFFVRVSFATARIALGSRVIQGFRESWALTKHHVWLIFWVYVVFIIIILMVLSVFEISLALALGNSVLYGVLISLVYLATTMIGSVGYSVVFYDLQSRHDASDLQSMIDDYKNE